MRANSSAPVKAGVMNSLAMAVCGCGVVGEERFDGQTCLLLRDGHGMVQEDAHNLYTTNFFSCHETLVASVHQRLDLLRHRLRPLIGGGVQRERRASASVVSEQPLSVDSVKEARQSESISLPGHYLHVTVSSPAELVCENPSVMCKSKILQGLGPELHLAGLGSRHFNYCSPGL